MRARAGIYVERTILGSLDEVWLRTQSPGVHARWDLRFTSITYLPKTTESEPQRFLYTTQIGLGLRISGTGETVGVRVTPDGSATSSLKFDSDEWLSLICSGSGYWRYVPQIDANGTERTQFLTWYNYDVRFGAVGRLVDALLFRPLIGWATAWSFDRLALWIETGQSPELSLILAAVYALARATIALVWIWHGLVPKLIFHDAGEQLMILQAGLTLRALPWIGGGEIAFGLAILLRWRQRGLLLLSALTMAGALVAVCLRSPQVLTAAFNPLTLNLQMVALSIIALLIGPYIPTASRCLRTQPARTTS